MRPFGMRLSAAMLIMGLAGWTVVASADEPLPDAADVQLVETGVIFDAAYSTMLRAQDRFFQFEPPYWTPGRADVARLENELPAYLRWTRRYGIESIIENLENYRRQYVGFSRGGKRMIHANAFCNHQRLDEMKDLTGTDWRTSYVVVADGGDCYFGVTYDADNGRFEGLGINGN